MPTVTINLDEMMEWEQTNYLKHLWENHVLNGLFRNQFYPYPSQPPVFEVVVDRVTADRFVELQPGQLVYLWKDNDGNLYELPTMKARRELRETGCLKIDDEEMEDVQARV